ncbi:MAG TPA: hypothetical protein VFW25_12910 [Silvibacterium sp.]|nr:hypothetical protein [Silvibacterium sp.]
MKALLIPMCLVCCAVLSVGQTPDAAQNSQPPNYSNYSIMLVNPALGGGAVVLMHSPKNELEFIPVNNTKQAFALGYTAVRAAELGELINALKEENARLSAENLRLQSQPAAQISAPNQAPSSADLEAQQKAQIADQKAARRQQMIQTWVMLRGMNRTQNLNVNVTNCNQSPALCAGR